MRQFCPEALIHLRLSTSGVLLYQELKERMDHFSIRLTGLGLNILFNAERDGIGQGGPSNILLRDIIEAAHQPIVRYRPGETVFDSETGVRILAGWY
jgi:hypothetical protein